MKLHFRIIFLFFLPVLGCYKVHKVTAEVNDNIYMEYFEVNPFGVREAYLTDSINFKVYIGEFDSDHEKIGCKIKGDTLVVFKNKAGQGGERVLMDETKLSREYLTRNKVNSGKPLFEFR